MSNNGKFLNLENGKRVLDSAIESSAGVSDASKIIKTDVNGLIDTSFIDLGVAGSMGDIQFNDGLGGLDATANLNWDGNRLEIIGGGNGAGLAALQIRSAVSSAEAIELYANNGQLGYEFNFAGDQPFFAIRNSGGIRLFQWSSSSAELSIWSRLNTLQFGNDNRIDFVGSGIRFYGTATNMYSINGNVNNFNQDQNDVDFNVNGLSGSMFSLNAGLDVVSFDTNNHSLDADDAFWSLNNTFVANVNGGEAFYISSGLIDLNFDQQAKDFRFYNSDRQWLFMDDSELNLTLDFDADKALLTNSPTGVVPLAIATVGYIDSVMGNINNIVASTTILIKENFQAIIDQEINIDGELDIQGELVII